MSSAATLMIRAMPEPLPVTRERIAATEAAIRAYVRRNPMVAANMADFGLAPGGPARAVAYPPIRRGFPAPIFVPDITPPAKAEMIRSCGAHLVFAGSR